MIDEGFQGDVAHFVVVVTAGDQGREERPHARPSGRVDRNPVLVQRPQQADVRESPGAATAQDQTDAASGELAREAGEIMSGTAPHVVMALPGDQLQPFQQRSCAGGLGPDHDQIDRRPCTAAPEFVDHRADQRRRAGVDDHQDAIRLAHAAARPGIGIGIRQIDQAFVIGFGAVEHFHDARVLDAGADPGLRMTRAQFAVDVSGIDQQRLRPGAERGVQFARHQRRVRIRRRRNHRETVHAALLLQVLGAPIGPQPGDDHARHHQQRFRMPADDREQILGRQLDQHAVANRMDRRCPRLTGQGADLADRLKA